MRITDFPLSAEVTEEYIELRRAGNCRTDATEELQARYACEITQGAEDDGLLFWIGLADGQYKRGELSSEVSEQAVRALDLLQQSDWGIAPGDIARRRLHYAEAPMPERKVGKPRPKFRCEWNIGDTFSYQLHGEEAEALGISGNYILLRKVSEIEFGDGRLLPVVTLSFWENDPLPSNSDEFQQAQILKLDRKKCEMPLNTYEYRAEILFKNRKQLSGIPLEYIGCFQDIPMPEDEYIFTHPGKISMILPENFDQRCCGFWRRHMIWSNSQNNT